MASGANIGMLANGVHGGVIILNAGNGFPTVALPAGQFCPYRVNVSGLLDVTGLAAKVPVEFDALVGVHQAGADAYPGCAGTVGEAPPGNPTRYAHDRALPLWQDLISLVIAGAGLVLLVSHCRGGHFLLGGSRDRWKKQRHQCRYGQ